MNMLHILIISLFWNEYVIRNYDKNSIRDGSVPFMEDCQSGLMGLFAKQVSNNLFHKFESYIFRFYLKIYEMWWFTKPIREPYVFLHNNVIFLKKINPYKAVDEFWVRYLTFHKPETIVKCEKLLKRYLTNHLDLSEIQNEETN